MRHSPWIGLLGFAAAGLAGSGDGTAAPDPLDLRALTRPVVLPFLWRALNDAGSHGDPFEAFVKAKSLLAALPEWTDGHAVFAYRFVLDGGDRAAAADVAAHATADRLQLGLELLETAILRNQAQQVDTLAAMSWLVELTARREPALAAHLPRDPAIIADSYLVRAEAIGAGRMVRETRLFGLPKLLAALLRAGDRTRAEDLLGEGLRRCSEIPEPDLRADWQHKLLGVHRALRGDPTVDRAALLADDRLQPLAPFLR